MEINYHQVLDDIFAGKDALERERMSPDEKNERIKQAEFDCQNWKELALERGQALTDAHRIAKEALSDLVLLRKALEMDWTFRVPNASLKTPDDLYVVIHQEIKLQREKIEGKLGAQLSVKNLTIRQHPEYAEVLTELQIVPGGTD